MDISCKFIADHLLGMASHELAVAVAEEIIGRTLSRSLLEETKLPLQMVLAG
jgi:hypothetical protein